MVVVLGSINMDLVVDAPVLPAPGETLLGGPFRTIPGGKGANQAVAAVRAGARVRMIGRVGADPFGQQLRAGLVADGVDTDHVGTCRHDPSGVALITVSADGENTIVVAPGANHMVRMAHVDDAVDAAIFTGASVVVAQLEVPMDVVMHAARLARTAGVMFVLNPSPVQPLSQELLGLVDVLIVNDTELMQLGGLDVLRSKAERHSPNMMAVVHTKGARGLDVHDGQGSLTISAHSVSVVDTTGAGDACCGAIVAGLAAGLDLRSAAARGNAAGAFATSHRGARTSPTAADIDLLLA